MSSAEDEARLSALGPRGRVFQVDDCKLKFYLLNFEPLAFTLPPACTLYSFHKRGCQIVTLKDGAWESPLGVLHRHIYVLLLENTDNKPRSCQDYDSSLPTAQQEQTARELEVFERAHHMKGLLKQKIIVK